MVNDTTPVPASPVAEPVVVGISDEELNTAIKEIQKFTEDRAKVLRDTKGKFKSKRPLEFTWPHFWLEVVEVFVAIVLATWFMDGMLWLLK